MRMPGIEVLLNFVPNPRKISPFSKEKSFFFSKTYAYLASLQLKNLTKRLKTVFFGERLVFKESMSFAHTSQDKTLGNRTRA